MHGVIGLDGLEEVHEVYVLGVVEGVFDAGPMERCQEDGVGVAGSLGEQCAPRGRDLCALRCGNLDLGGWRHGWCYLTLLFLAFKILNVYM